MARQYPRFLYSNPKGTKSKGPFVVHLLSPRFICRVEDDVEKLKNSGSHYVHASGWTLELLEVFEFSEINQELEKKISDIMHDMISWLPKQQQEIEVLYDNALDSSIVQLMRTQKERNKLEEVVKKIHKLTSDISYGSNLIKVGEVTPKGL